MILLRTVSQLSIYANRHRISGHFVYNYSSREELNNKPFIPVSTPNTCNRYLSLRAAVAVVLSEGGPEDESESYGGWLSPIVV